MDKENCRHGQVTQCVGCQLIYGIGDTVLILQEKGTAEAAAYAVLDGLEFADFIFSSKSELNGLQGILSPCHGFFWHQAQCTERKNQILLLKNLTLNADENI